MMRMPCWALSERRRQPFRAIHTPTLLLTQQVWGSAWSKIQRSAEMAAKLGTAVVVVHPPFRWQNGWPPTCPHWDPVDQDYDDVTWDFSHAATAEVSSPGGGPAAGQQAAARPSDRRNGLRPG